MYLKECLILAVPVVRKHVLAEIVDGQFLAAFQPFESAFAYLSNLKIILWLSFKSNEFKPFSCSDGSAIGFFGSIFGLKSSHCFKTGGITGGFALASNFVNRGFFFVGIFLSPLFRIIGLFDFRFAFISWHLLVDPDTDLVADGTLEIISFWSWTRLDNLESLILWLAAELCRDFRRFGDLALLAPGDCDREGANDCDCDGADDLKLVSFSVCCLSRTWPGLKIFLSNFSFGQSVLHHQSKSLFKHRNYSLD